MIKDIVDALIPCILPDLPVTFGKPSDASAPPFCVIQVVDCSYQPKLMGRCLIRRPLDLQFTPAPDQDLLLLFQALEQLLPHLEYLSLPDGLIRGSDIHIHWDEGLVHLLVSYDSFSFSSDPQEKMDQMQVNSSLRS